MDPECAPMDEINEWLVGKKSMLYVVQYKPDFAVKKYLRQNEMYLPSISLEPQYFSDVGYRYRINDFITADEWYIVKDTPDITFTDYAFFNVDTFNQDPELDSTTVL